ncbi:hypothetical protein FGO68_gene616 [Halteria grandinella]|uniref:Uncharacterized protein n=1 Tax=Halteria grandinella TaxID=5974 RepID=A0A8J8SVU6_HALGN|nr:hypothetical protein FGO68_gene616 [Halteria grandinella]
MWTDQIQSEDQELQDLRVALFHMESPFGFIKGFHLEQQAMTMAQHRNDEMEERKEQTLAGEMGLTPEIAARLDAMEEREHELEEKLDAVANNLALKYGYDSVPWFALTWWVLWIYTILTLLVMFLRPDFLNLTICIIGLYMMFNTDRITKNKFRMLVFGVALSIVYDLVWFFMKHQEYAPDVGATETTSGVEAGVKKFSLMMAYTSFFFRFFVMIVLWKDSLDFSKIIQNRTELPVLINSNSSKQTTKIAGVKNVYLRNHKQV